MRKMVYVENDIRYGELDFRGEKLKDVARMVAGLIDQYGDEAQLDISNDYDDGVSLTVTSKRLETDYEMNTRINKEAIMAQTQRDRDMETYRRIQNMYGLKGYE